MALDPGTILCMTQYNKTDIYTLLDDGTQYRLVSLTYCQGSSEPSLRSIASASKLSLGEIRRPLDCYGRSSDAAFIAVMPGTRATYTDPTLRGLRVDFDKSTADPIWSAAEVNLMYNESAAPTASLLFPHSSYLMHFLDGPTGQTFRAYGWGNYSRKFANSMTLGHISQTNNIIGSEIFLANVNSTQFRYYRAPSEAYLARINPLSGKDIFGVHYPMGGSECLPGGLAASSLTTFYFLCEINGGASPKQYRLNFYSLAGSLTGIEGFGHLDLQSLPEDVLSWRYFLVHENSFRDAAFATLVGSANEAGSVTTKLYSQWVGDSTIDLMLPTPDNTIRQTGPTGPNKPNAPASTNIPNNNMQDPVNVKVISGIASGVFAVVAIGLLYLRWKRISRQKLLDGLQKLEDPRQLDRMGNDDGAFAPTAGDDTLKPHIYSSPIFSSEEALISYKLDDGPARSNLRLQPAPMLLSTTQETGSLDTLALGSSTLNSPRSFSPPAPLMQGAPVIEHIPLDRVQFSRHPRPNIATRMG